MAADALTLEFQKILSDLLLKAPEIFDRVVMFFDTLAKRNQGTPVSGGPSKAPTGPLDLTGDTGDGTYTLVSTGLDENVREAILKGVAEGQVREKAGQWVAGFITGVMLASG